MRAALRDAVTGQLAPPVNSAGMTTRLDHSPLVMVSGAPDMQAARPISQPGATGVPLATGTTVTPPPLSLGSGGTTITPATGQSGLLKKPWLLAVIGGAIALVAVLGLLLARGAGGSAEPRSQPAHRRWLSFQLGQPREQPTSSPALNATEIRQTVAAEVMADLTAEAVKRATDIAFARTLANATDSAGTQTAIALTPTGTSPPTEAPTAAPALAPATPTSAPAAAKPTRAEPTNTGPKSPPARQRLCRPVAVQCYRSASTGDLFKGAARKGTIDPAVGDGGSCIQGTVLSADGSKFSSFYVQVDNRGTTKPAKHFYDTGNYRICGLGAGEWGVAVYAVNNTPTSGAEQAGHQVRVQLSGQPGEVFYVDFRASQGFAPPTEVPEPTAVPPTPVPLAGPYDGQWAGTIRGKTAGDQDFTGNFRFEVRHNAIYSVAT